MIFSSKYLYDLYICKAGETNVICVLSHDCLVDVYLCMKRASHSVKNAFMVHTINMLTVLCNSVAVFLTPCERHVLIREFC